MNQLIAYCGIDCERCDARIATVTDDWTLREKTAKLWSELNQVEIPPEAIRCMGCRTEGVKTPFCESMCPIRKCAGENHFCTCGDCGEVETCGTVRSVFISDPQAMERLREKD